MRNTTPVLCEEVKKPVVKHERRVAAKAEQSPSVRPEVAKLINKVVRENAPTWKALAKR